MKNKRSPNVPGAVEAALTAILAALRWREDFETGHTAEAIRKAHKLIELVPDYLSGKKTSPGQSVGEAFQDYCLEIDDRMEEAREWGLPEPWSREFYEKYEMLPERRFHFRPGNSPKGLSFSQDNTRSGKVPSERKISGNPFARQSDFEVRLRAG